MSVTTKPRASLGRVIEDLGNTLLEVVSGAVDDDTEIETVVIHDVLDDAMPMRRALVLGVGLSDPDEIAELLRVLATQQASALVLRAPVRSEQPVREASEATGIPVLALTRGASWAQLAAMLRSLIAEGDVGDQGATTLGGMPSGDLFALANAIATPAERPRDDRGSQLPGRRLLGPPARSRPRPHRDGARTAGARTVRTAAGGARRLPGALPQRGPDRRRPREQHRRTPLVPARGTRGARGATRSSARSGPRSRNLCPPIVCAR